MMNHATLMRIGEAARAYYDEARPLVKPEYFSLWLEAVSPELRKLFSEKGFDYTKTALPFLRFVMEMNDKGMDMFMKEKLSEEDFKFWISTEKETEYKKWISQRKNK